MGIAIQRLACFADDRQRRADANRRPGCDQRFEQNAIGVGDDFDGDFIGLDFKDGVVNFDGIAFVL
jgi:hypothetical protein